MASDIDIASNALLRIGANPISSFTEGGAEGTVADNLYEPTIRDLFTKARWRFASAKRQLARLTATPLNEFKYAYQLPSDMLYMYRVYPYADYEIVSDKLYSDETEVYIDYIYRPDESKWPAYFQLLAEYKLASEFALSITDNRALNELYETKAMMQLRAARHADSQGRPVDGIQRFKYVDVRG